MIQHSEDRHLAAIVSALDQILLSQEQDDFAIFRLPGPAGYTIEAINDTGTDMIFLAAKSNTYLSAEFQLSDAQIANIIKLGWQPPMESRKLYHFTRHWPAQPQEQRVLVAQLILRTFELGYGMGETDNLQIDITLQ